MEHIKIEIRTTNTGDYMATYYDADDGDWLGVTEAYPTVPSLLQHVADQLAVWGM